MRSRPCATVRACFGRAALADGGNIFLSATTEASDNISGSDIGALQPKDFELIDGGARINSKAQNCTRTPVSA